MLLDNCRRKNACYSKQHYLDIISNGGTECLLSGTNGVLNVMETNFRLESRTLTQVVSLRLFMVETRV
jgi:hypothetical protein